MSGSKKRSDRLAPAGGTTNYDELIKRCDKGDKAALSELRALLAKPEAAKLYDLDILVANVERSWLDVCLGKDSAVKEFAKVELRRLRKDVAGPNPSPLESLLADRIALCWLQLQYADTIYAQNMSQLTHQQSEHMQNRQDRAHRRFLAAVKTLAQVRKLGVPVVQFNIAEKQVNVVTASGQADPATQDPGDVADDPEE